MVVFLVIQLAATLAALALMWRKVDQLNSEIARLRRTIESMALDRAPAKRTRARAEPALARGDVKVAPAATPWPEDRPHDRLRAEEPRLVVVDDLEDASVWRGIATPDRQRAALIAALAASPLLAAPLGAAWADLVGAGLLIAAALIVASLRRPEVAWIGALAGAAWAIGGATLGAAAAAPLTYAAAAGVAGACGLIHTWRRQTTHGVIVAGATTLGLLLLGTSAGMIGPAGAALTIAVTLAAILGASSLRLEAMHLAAFAAAGAGLFVLSAQEGAAIWFTPAAALVGALFLGIAAVRVPQLGAHGGAIAGAGAGASLFAVGALYVSQHGLANPYAAAGAFTALAGVFAALIALAARRRPGGVRALRLTLWTLAFAAFAAIASAVFIIALAPLAAALMSAVALGLVALDRRVPALAWRTHAIGALTLAGLAAWSSAIAFADANPVWPHGALIAVGFAAPAALVAAAAIIPRRKTARGAGEAMEAGAVLFALFAASLGLRWGFSAGLVSANPIGFLEAGAHVGLWLGAGLVLAKRQRPMALVALPAFIAGPILGLLWLTPFWLERPISGVAGAIFQHAPLGFLLMAIPAWAHWAHWRAHGAYTRTRVTFAAAALASAGYVTLMVFWLRRGADVPGLDYVVVASACVTFALAFGLSAAPGVVEPRTRYRRRRTA